MLLKVDTYWLFAKLTEPQVIVLKMFIFFILQKIGDYYRGYVDTEVELDILLTYHKQATQSFWGTRQSPSPAKQSTRFMWKSQYVPYDGIPFVNTGMCYVIISIVCFVAF